LALLLVLHTRNNTDGNKLVIFSGIASYYGDNYILSPIGYSLYFVQSENKTIRNTIWRWVCRKNRYREHHSSCISRCIVKGSRKYEDILVSKQAFPIMQVYIYMRDVSLG